MSDTDPPTTNGETNDTSPVPESGLAPNSPSPVIARPLGDSPTDIDPFAQRAPDPRPGVWSTIGIVIGTLLAGVIVQVIVLAILGRGDPELIVTLANSHDGLLIALLTVEGTMLMCCILAAVASTGTIRDQLGIVSSIIPRKSYAVLLLGTILVAAVGQVLAIPVTALLGGGEAIAQMRMDMGWLDAVRFVIAIGIVPGIVEEIFLRGYVQRRLLRRMRPWKAILLASVLFAIMHVDPGHVVFAFPVGIWLGVIAWRGGSVWPCVVCHAGLNAIWNAYFIPVTKLDSMDTAAWVAIGCGVVILVASVFGFVASVKLLRRTKPAPHQGSPLGEPTAEADCQAT